MLAAARILALLLAPLLAALSAAAPAAAAPITFDIDPVQSNVSLSGSVSIDFGLPGGPIDMDLFTQVGSIPGVSGDVLPSGVLSDGLVTSVGGQIDADLDLGAGTFESLGGPVTPGISGTWSPGNPVTDPLGPAQAGALFTDSTTFSGIVALRDLELALTTSVLSLDPIGGGAYELGAGSTGVWSLTAGFLDQSTNFGTAGRITLNLDFSVVDLAGATLLPTVGGGYALTLPVALDVSLDADDFGIAFPLFVDVQLAGTVVGNGTIIPEPASGALVASGLALLGLWKRHGSRC